MKIRLTKKLLVIEYLKYKKSRSQIAKELGYSSSGILYYLKKYNISRRTISEGKKNKLRPDVAFRNKLRNNKGKKNGNYKNGITLESHYCKICREEICLANYYYGSRICRKCYLNNSISPNKIEKKLNGLLNKLLPNEYKFVGDAQIIINGFYPDFINVNGQKKIIELYGDYWHNLENAKKRNTRRLKAYKKYGYKTLIIWEHEFKNLKEIKEKIKNFNKRKVYDNI